MTWQLWVFLWYACGVSGFVYALLSLYTRKVETYSDILEILFWSLLGPIIIIIIIWIHHMDWLTRLLNKKLPWVK